MSALAINAGKELGLSLDALETPRLILDKRQLARNIAKLKQRLASFGVAFRPHLKTAKSIDVARLVIGDEFAGKATVSTLKEAEYFFAHGIRDLLYAVGIAPNKLDHVFDLRRRGANLSIILDNVETARLVAEKSVERNDPLPVLIEIDTDGHRSGVGASDQALIEIGKILHEGGAALRGVLAHAGSSYTARGRAPLEEIAERERAETVDGAQRLRDAGLPCLEVSVGSTPTTHFAKNLSGVSEVRAGVFIFFDLVMTGIGVCDLNDIALSVLATVIGHQSEKGWIIVDAGWMAMSRDRGTARQATDQGYGLVCDLAGKPISDLIMIDANQEHGILAMRPGAKSALPTLSVGSMVRILPNHACATAAQHDRYLVVEDEPIVSAVWPRISGW